MQTPDLCTALCGNHTLCLASCTPYQNCPLTANEVFAVTNVFARNLPTLLGDVDTTDIVSPRSIIALYVPLGAIVVVILVILWNNQIIRGDTFVILLIVFAAILIVGAIIISRLTQRSINAFGEQVKRNFDQNIANIVFQAYTSYLSAQRQARITCPTSTSG